MRLQPDLSSIIMLCYNGAKHLHRSIDSILNQTYPHIELIFINDGSSDNTLEVINSYMTKFDEKGYKLKIINNALNIGVGASSKIGLENASGEYLSLLDSDDILLPTSIEERISALKQNTFSNIVRTNGYIVKSNNVDDCNKLISHGNKKIEEQSLFENIAIGIANNTPGTYMVRTERLKKFYGDNPYCESRYGQNLQIILPCAWQTKAIFINKPLMKYVIYENSLSRPISLERKLEMLKGYYQIRLFILTYFNLKISILKKMHNNYLRLCVSTIYSSQEEQQTKQILFNEYYNKLKSEKGNNAEYRLYNAIINNAPYCKILYHRTCYFLLRHLKLK